VLHSNPISSALNYDVRWTTNDNKVNEDYAAKLLPRAVGYSAGLLDYFFRGSIDIQLPSKQYHSGIYAMTTDPDQGFTRIVLNARNTTPDGEKMTDGTIKLVVKYKLALDDPFQSHPVPTTETFSYIVAPEANNIRAIPSDEYAELTFDLNSALPINATDVTINLVYKGSLGEEADAVAVGYKDISEPTPIDIFSNLDKVCLAGKWYDAGSPDAIALVDTNGNNISDRNEVDVYPHDLQDIYLRVSQITDPRFPSDAEKDIHIPELKAGEFKRVAFILSEHEFALSFDDTNTMCSSPDDHDSIGYVYADTFACTGIENQTYAGSPAECNSLGAESPCTIRHYPTFTSFRGKEIRDLSVIVYNDESWGHDTSCSLDDFK
jgi:hypothetical protein